MTPTLYTLALDAIEALGQAALTAHEDLERWRDTPLSPADRTKKCDQLKSYICKQYQWLEALRNHNDTTKGES